MEEAVVGFDAEVVRIAAEGGFETRGTVLPEWIDYNGHMNVAYYLVAFDHGLDGFVDTLDFDAAARQRTQMTTMTLEGHIQYLGELMEGQAYRVHNQLYDYDSKRMHIAQTMYGINEDGSEFLSSTMEWMSLSVSLETRRSAPFRQEVIDAFDAVWAVQKDWEKPTWISRSIGLPPGKSMVR